MIFCTFVNSSGMRTFNTLSVPLEVKCWHQFRSCRQSSLTVAYPYCYRVFDMTGGGLGTLHARLRHVGRDAVARKGVDAMIIHP